MTWIKTVPISSLSPELAAGIDEVMKLYPPEYALPVESLKDPDDPNQGAAIVMAHSLIPQALKHAFATFGALMSADLPLSRKDHEMIAATVSSVNSCFY